MSAKKSEESAVEAEFKALRRKSIRRITKLFGIPIGSFFAIVVVIAVVTVAVSQSGSTASQIFHAPKKQFAKFRKRASEKKEALIAEEMQEEMVRELTIAEQEIKLIQDARAVEQLKDIDYYGSTSGINWIFKMKN